MGISINGPSGIDTSYIIDSLTDMEYERVRRVEQQKAAYDLKIQAYSKLQSFVSDVSSKAFSLNNKDDFGLFAENSSNEDIVTVTGAAGSTPGSYGVRVFNVAQHEKMVSADGIISSQTEALSSFGIGTGTISIEGTEIDITATDTIQDARRKINNATDADGKELGVSASVIKMSDTNFRLVLSAKDTGSGGIAYKDVSGTALQDLGIIHSADGNKGNTTQVLTSTDDINTIFSGLVAGDTIQYGGVDHNGNEVSNTFIVKASSTVDDLLQQVEETYNGMADATIDATGNLVLTSKVEGSSQMTMTSLNIAGTDYQMNVSVAGDEGAGVLSVGSNAYFSVDSLYMESKSNAAQDFIAGVTLNLNKADAGETVAVEIDRDYEAITKKVKDLIDSFNALHRFSKESTTYGDPEDEDSDGGVLAGDMTVSSIVSRIRKLFQTQFENAPTYKNLTMAGVETDYNTGRFTLDEERFKEALQKSFDEVVDLFVTSGASDNANITLGIYDENVKSGTYTLEEINGNQQVRITGSDGTSYDSDVRTGEIVSFSEGLAAGLKLTFPAGTLAAGETASFTFTRGLSDIIKDEIDGLTDSKEGLISLRQETYRSSINRANDRITKLEARVEKYRERLVREFSYMEQVMAELQSQSTNMLSALG
ncbi:MAG: flagellar filament capping protein FliD [Chitinivibrionales bacterium]|nr:flagellar filament capping protein FliD [Chitinivibrionales bacterium]